MSSFAYINIFYYIKQTSIFHHLKEGRPTLHTPLQSDSLNVKARSTQISSTTSFSTIAEILSGPGDFDSFRSFSAASIQYFATDLNLILADLAITCKIWLGHLLIELRFYPLRSNPNFVKCSLKAERMSSLSAICLSSCSISSTAVLLFIYFLSIPVWFSTFSTGCFEF